MQHRDASRAVVEPLPRREFLKTAKIGVVFSFFALCLFRIKLYRALIASARRSRFMCIISLQWIPLKVTLSGRCVLHVSHAFFHLVVHRTDLVPDSKSEEKRLDQWIWGIPIRRRNWLCCWLRVPVGSALKNMAHFTNHQSQDAVFIYPRLRKLRWPYAECSTVPNRAGIDAYSIFQEF